MTPFVPENAVLGILGKQPTPGRVKTRLAADYGFEAAAQIHEAMLLDLLDLWASEHRLPRAGRIVLAFDPPESESWFASRLPSNIEIRPQADGDLGRRMHTFLERMFREGAEQVVLIGTDSPTLDPEIVRVAFDLLRSREVVLGPAVDGGYYLIGCRPPVPPLFDAVEWGTARVLDQTIERIEASSRSMGLLPPWYDVDDSGSWRFLAAHLRAMEGAGQNLGLRRIAALIARERSGL